MKLALLIIAWTLISPPYSTQTQLMNVVCPMDSIIHFNGHVEVSSCEQDRWLITGNRKGREFVGLNLPCPIWPAREWYGRMHGDTLDMHWQSIWDADDNGWIDLSDFAKFGEGWQVKWDLSHLAAFGLLMDGPNGFEWRYKR
jgi:hypothetical protein